MGKHATRLFIALALCAGQAASAKDYVWQIGGGQEPANSQAQIEFNVNWVGEVLRARVPQALRRVYYTDGGAGGRDIVEWVRAPETKEALTPLARVFGAYDVNGNRFRDQRIVGVTAGTEAKSLTDRLARDFEALRPGDRALILYNGHGLGDDRDAANNTLRLWEDTKMTAREFEALLARVPVQVPVRFVFTQCYSGGFARLVHPQARDVLALAEGERCGFLAESATREAEGCSAGINVGDYRDYTTYFFAALDGRTRLGKPIDGNPDRDGDGIVNLYEAHLYALGEAHNADLPRATSEAFLERWQPWYLRWGDSGEVPDNVYGELAREVSARLGLAVTTREFREDVFRRRAALNDQSRTLDAEQGRLREEIRALQRSIQKDVALRWPEVRQPHTLAYARFLAEQVSKAQDFMLNHGAYRQLVVMQDRHLAIDGEKLGVERDSAQLDKVMRLRTLARLSEQFGRLASAEERDWYERLLSCEKRPL